MAEMTPEEIGAGQREYQRKFESGEFTKEALARKARLEAAAPDLLSACMSAMRAFSDDPEPSALSIAAAADCRAAIAKAQCKPA